MHHGILFDRHVRYAHALPGQLRGVCMPCHSRGWGISIFCAAWGRAFANPRATPELLAHTCIPIQTYILNMEDFIKITSRLAYLACQGQEKLLEGF